MFDFIFSDLKKKLQFNYLFMFFFNLFFNCCESTFFCG